MNIFSFIASLFKTEETTSKEVLQILNDGAALAVQDAKFFNYKLDYSNNSIKNVDTILIRFRKIYSKTDNKAELENLALVFGLYVIAVFERNYGPGYLQRRLTGHNEDSFPYYRKGELIFPCIWCLNKLFDDNAEDIWIQYNSFI